jgi:hypothetical protein
VINTGSLGTYFDCTSTSSAPQTVTVEAFDQDGLASGSGALVVAPGKRVRFGTVNASGLQVDSVFGSGTITSGAARLLSTDKKCLCHAFVATLGPVPSMCPLTIVAKLKQKAAN